MNDTMQLQEPSEIVCIVCPNGCRIRCETVAGELQCSGQKCKRGVEYVKAELIRPMRSLTTSVKTVFPDSPVVSVRTSGEIEKAKLREVVNAIRSHAGYGMPAMIREFKSSRTFFLSESRKFDLSANVESTFTVNRGSYILFETYLQTVRSGKIIIMNEKNGIEQILPVASTDYLQIYLPMRTTYKIVTIKDNDYDSWIMEFFAHERLRIELL